MKILLVTPIYPPDIGGPATFIPNLGNHLVSKKHKIITITLHEINNKLIIFEQSNSQELIRINRKLPFVIRQLITIVYIFTKGLRTNIIFANGLFEETYFANTFLKKPLICKVVGDPIWEKRGRKKKSIEEYKGLTDLNLIEKFRRYLFSKSLNSAKLIISPSMKIIEALKIYDVNTEINYMVNSVPKYKICETKAEYELITICRLVKWKNVDQIIRVAIRLNLNLAIIGDGPELKNLQKISKNYGHLIKFFGKIAESDIRQILAKSEIYINFSDYEGMSFSLLQAMMAGKAIIISNNQGNSDTIESDNCIKVKVNDVVSLEKAVQILTKNKSEINRMGRLARKQAEETYSDDIQMDKYEETMSKLAK